jgi:hypothetical protein
MDPKVAEFDHFSLLEQPRRRIRSCEDRELAGVPRGTCRKISSGPAFEMEIDAPSNQTFISKKFGCQ